MLNQIKKSIPKNVQILVVTKNQLAENIIPLLQENHYFYGENNVSEALNKWPNLKREYPNVKLHMLGHLQTNKVKKALELFDVIATIDSIKLAKKIASFPHLLKEKIFYIQLNIANELQKTGVNEKDLEQLFNYCTNELSLNIQGLMCVPPVNESPILYFQKLANLAKYFKLPIISMGMSDDYNQAIECGATEIRLGRIIFS